MPCGDRYAWPVRIARFAAGGDPQYGVVELAEDGGRYPDTVSVLTGDPMAMTVKLTGERKELDAVRLLAPVIPRSKIVAAGRSGKFNRNKTWTTWTLSPSGHATKVEVTTEAEVNMATDKFLNAVLRRRGWLKRGLRKGLRRMQSILEEDLDRGERATVGGL